MKECPNCGKQLKLEDTFCNNCGYDYNNANNLELEENKPQTEHKAKRFVSKINYGPNLFNDDDEQYLLDEYIGRNVLKMKHGFSLPTLLFSSIYFLYRKMWGLGIITILANIAIFFFIPNQLLGLGIYFAYNFILALVFKEIYIQKANKEVSKIQSENPDTDVEELAIVVGNKGGVSNAVLLIATFGTIIFVIFNAVAIISGAKTLGTSLFDLAKDRLKEAKESAEKLDDGIREKSETRAVGNLYIVFPKGYTPDRDVYEDEAGFTNRSNCHISTKYVDAMPFGNNVITYLNLKVKQTTVNSNLEYEEKTIHGQLWTFVKSPDTIPKFATYVTIYNGQLYDVTFQTDDKDNTTCLFNLNATVNTFTFREK